jgi:glyoxylase-like metal-dependent hydrolase (beta-lactamase superfamily II)
MTAADEFLEHEGGGFLGRLGGGGRRATDQRVPVSTFLIRHPSVGPVLVDTGLHPSVASDPRHNMGRGPAGYFQLDEGRDVTNQLRNKGIGPGDVVAVILTHLHLDNASAISEFPESIFVVSADEWREATEHPKLRRGYRPQHYDHAFDYCTVDFDGDPIESYGPFGRTFDLFGDGSVRLAFTPGHSAGHMSVICRLPRRDFVICGDASYDWTELDGDTEPDHVQDRHNWQRSLKEMQAYRQGYPYALLVPGHDAAYWAKLDARYEQ